MRYHSRVKLYIGLCIIHIGLLGCAAKQRQDVVTVRGCLWQGPKRTPEWCGKPIKAASESLTDRRNEEHLRREVNSPRPLERK